MEPPSPTYGDSPYKQNYIPRGIDAVKTFLSSRKNLGCAAGTLVGNRTAWAYAAARRPMQRHRVYPASECPHGPTASSDARRCRAGTPNAHSGGHGATASAGGAGRSPDG